MTGSFLCGGWGVAAAGGQRRWPASSRAGPGGRRARRAGGIA